MMIMDLHVYVPWEGYHQQLRSTSHDPYPCDIQSNLDYTNIYAFGFLFTRNKSFMQNLFLVFA